MAEHFVDKLYVTNSWNPLRLVNGHQILSHLKQKGLEDPGLSALKSGMNLVRYATRVASIGVKKSNISTNERKKECNK
jgi:hypothetical protein